jgi:hypothetical protein
MTTVTSVHSAIGPDSRLCPDLDAATALASGGIPAAGWPADAGAGWGESVIFGVLLSSPRSRMTLTEGMPDSGLARHGIEGSAQRRKRRRLHKHINMIEAGYEFDREIRLRWLKQHSDRHRTGHRWRLR